MDAMHNARLLHCSHCVAGVERSRAVVECCVVRDPGGFPIEIVQVPELHLVPYGGRSS
jgi:hypothetical protein